jgi:hypothetical protein
VIRNRPILLAVASLLVSGLAGGCRVDAQKFQDRVFSCNTAAANPLCGTDLQGDPMKCYAAEQIGATDFCTEECGDTPGRSADGKTVCVQGGAQLSFCNPADDNDKVGHPNGACGRPEFGCLRTDILKDEGVCLTMNPCLTSQDCHDAVLSVCAATFYKQLYSANTTFHADHLYCLQEGCQADSTSCLPGQTCLRNVIPAAAHPPDICVPNCDSNLQCPPNHFCLQKISGPANPAVCIPGLLGFVCDTDVDCVVGTCMDDGGTGRPDVPDNLRLCTTTCTNDNDCNIFDSDQGRFICNQASGTCATPNAYQGAACGTDSDCIREDGALCARFAPTDPQGTCLHPCRDDGSCLPRGGINETCLPLDDADQLVPVCFPGLFGLPCFADTNCVGEGVSCRGLDLTTQPPTPGLCTALCASDADCAGNRWTAGGWCGSEAPICLPPQAAGLPCTRASMCASGLCVDAPGDPDGGVQKICG